MKLWWVALLVPMGPVLSPAQSSLDVLDSDLKQLQEERSQHMSKEQSAFMAALDKAAANPQAAVELYTAAGGESPAATEVKSHYEVETPTERSQREAVDNANMSAFSSLVQAHCGMMRFAALYATDPSHPNLDQDWSDWLKKVATDYPQWMDVDRLKRETMRESKISTYLGFAGWGTKESGAWKLDDLPMLYRQVVLEPLHTADSPDVLPAWDAYIAMRHADQSSDAKWAAVDYPALEFDRDCDAFHLQPSAEALAPLVQIIKDNPTHAQGDSWLQTVKGMITSLRGSAPIPLGETPPGAAAPSQEVMAQELPMTNSAPGMAPARPPKSGP